MNSSYDSEADAYYFEDRDASGKISVKQVYLGNREIFADIDMDGHIIGIEVL